MTGFYTEMLSERMESHWTHFRLILVSKPVEIDED